MQSVTWEDIKKLENETNDILKVMDDTLDLKIEDCKRTGTTHEQLLILKTMIEKAVESYRICLECREGVEGEDREKIEYMMSITTKRMKSFVSYMERFIQ